LFRFDTFGFAHPRRLVPLAFAIAFAIMPGVSVFQPQPGSTVRRRVKKYQFASSRRRSGNFLYWLLALVLAAVLAALWWHSGRVHPAKPRPQPAAVVARPVAPPPSPSRLS
jgi:hypothetical protein